MKIMEKSRIVFEGYGYLASIAGYSTENGPFLCVTRKNKGCYLSGDNARTWAEAIETAIDKQEARALCAAIYAPH